MHTPPATQSEAGPTLLVVQCPSEKQAEGVYGLSAEYRGLPVWTLSGVEGSKIVFAAVDGRWYVGGDGSEEQGWLRSESRNAAQSRLPLSVERWELRQGDEWRADCTVRVFEPKEPDSLLCLNLTTLQHLAGWYTKTHHDTWESSSGGHHAITDRRGHWIVSCVDNGAVLAATVAPHYGAFPSPDAEWVLLSPGVEERESSLRAAAVGCRQRAEEYRQQAARLLALAEDEEAAGGGMLRQCIGRKQEAAKDAEAALWQANQAIEQAARIRRSQPEGDIQREVRERALHAARAAQHATGHAQRLLCDSSSASSASSASAAPTAPPPSPSIDIYVPGAPILCGRYTPAPDPPHLYSCRDFVIYDNNGYWAVGTAEDVSKGVGWLATVQKHRGRPPYHSGLSWRKWVGHDWEGDDNITVSRGSGER